MVRLRRSGFYKLFPVYLFLFFFVSISLNAQEILIFPKPREMKILEGNPFRINGDTKIIINSGASESDRMAIADLNNKIYNRLGYELSIIESAAQIPVENIIVIGEPAKNRILTNLLNKNNIEFNRNNPGEQGYVMFSNSDVVLISGNDAAGVFYGIQSLINIIDSSRGRSINIPSLLIRDFPGMKFRELFNEDKWGPDRMTLEDYKGMIDFMSGIKMNSLSVGIYGCWGVQYRNKILEYFMLPVETYPQLQTPKLIEYYSPKNGGWQKLDYLPTIFTDDFFGELIKYGKKKHVSVYPKFNSLGHNTLLPRIFPEISAKDEQGNPIGYGFCTFNEKTYEILFNIFDNIIDKYLKPNGKDWFDIEMDEVRQWCKCEKCRHISEEDIYLEHIIKLAKYLKSKGMRNIGVWADMLNNKKMVNNELLERFEREGLKDNIILHWWRYTEPIYETIYPELGLRNWVVPMTGYSYPYHFYYNCSRLHNVYRMLELGHNSEAEGASSYSIFDPGYHFSNTALADLSWNPSDSAIEDGMDGYIKDYSKKIFGKQWKEAKLIFENLEEFYPGYSDISRAILYYRYSYVRTEPYKKNPYPENAFKELKRISNSKEKLERMAGITNNAKRFFKSVLNSKDVERDIIVQFYANILRMSNLVEEFLLLNDIEEDYQKFKSLSDIDVRLQLLKEIKSAVNKIFALQIEALKVWEDIKPAYLHPQCMRNMSFMLKFCEESVKRIDKIESKTKSNSLDEIPDTLIIGTYEEL